MNPLKEKEEKRSRKEERENQQQQQRPAAPLSECGTLLEHAWQRGVTGAMIDGKGYVAATVKKLGGVPVTVENCSLCTK